MVLSTFVFSVFRSFLSVFMAIIINPWYLLKVGFLWICMAITSTFLYFLWSHQDYMHKLRVELFFLLLKSLWFGFLCVIALTGLYEFILQMMCESILFQHSANTICRLSLFHGDVNFLFKILATGYVVLSTLWACHFVEPLLEQWHEKHVVHGYGWFMIISSIFYLIFLWSVGY